MESTKILTEMMALAERLGTVTQAHLYENDFLSVEGKTADGRAFTLNFAVEGNRG